MLMQASRQHDKLLRQFADIGRRKKFLKLNAKVCLKRLPCTSRSNPELAEMPLFLAIQFAVLSPIQISSCREIEEICFFVIFHLDVGDFCALWNIESFIANSKLPSVLILRCLARWIVNVISTSFGIWLRGRVLSATKSNRKESWDHQLSKKRRDHDICCLLWGVSDKLYRDISSFM